jgi:hypothetical protein
VRKWPGPEERIAKGDQWLDIDEIFDMRNNSECGFKVARKPGDSIRP